MKNNFTDCIEQIRQMLSEGAYIAVCTKLKHWIVNIRIREEVIQISARLHPALKNFSQGVITYGELESIQNKVCNALLLLLKEIKEEDVANDCNKQEDESLIGAIYMQEKIYKDLEKNFLILKSPKERTQEIIEDLESLLKLPSDQLENTVIWTTSFLSIFSITDKDPYYKDEKKLLALLNKEKNTLIALASKGCKIKCIISPANTKYRSQQIEYAKYRTGKLKEFLEKGSELALANIEWAASEYTQGNVYIIGKKSIYFGYKKGSDPLGKSYDFTLRQRNEYVVKSHSNIYETFFENLSCINLANWIPNEKLYYNANILRRKAVVSILEKSIRFLNGLQSFETDL